MTRRLERIHIQGLASIKDLTLEPGPLTVLIGPNGAGKSNILSALKLVPLMRTRSLQRYVGEQGGASALLHYGPKVTPTLRLTLDFVDDDDGSGNRYEAHLGYTRDDRFMFLDETVGYQPAEGADWRLTSLGASHWESRLWEASDRGDVTAKTVNYCLSQLFFFHFHDTSYRSELRTNAKAEDDRYLRSDGSNLAAYLYRIAHSDDGVERKVWRRIQRLIRRVAPAIKELRPTRVDNGDRAVRLDWIDDRDERFGVHHLSDGTLRALALITALSQPGSRLPGFMCIDEPELGLHPAAIGLLSELARSVSHRSQILFSTQSTAFIDYFAPGEVVVVERKEGETRLERLDGLAP